MAKVTCRIVSSAALAMSLALSGNVTNATPSPRTGGSLPVAFAERVEAQPPGQPAFTFKRSLTQVTQRSLLARQIAQVPRVTTQLQGAPDAQLDAILKVFGSVESFSAAQHVSGDRRIPVLTIKFADHNKPPYPVANLQTELFDGPWPTGTMRDFYREISGGRLNLTGTVAPWVSAAKKSNYYEGADVVDKTGQKQPCFGMCPNTRVGELISEAIAAPVNAQIDWAQYDNNGPDGIPNSSDDDGFVDFVAFVHSEAGGECETEGNKNIWSHRWTLTDMIGKPYETRSPKHGGGFIMIDDYVIQPGLACDNKTMIEIGVFAHEFGHAFGLPDLYDNDDSNGASAGIGRWCLMAGGSWGGDGNSPSRPSHMSPWAKEFLGWVGVEPVARDEDGATLQEIQDSRTIRKMGISSNTHYLLANVQQRGFNARLPAGGLQIWKINQTVITSGLKNNRVNAHEFNRGVELVEADGNRSLNDPAQPGQPGDVFPGSSNNTFFDASTTPASAGRVSVCNISASSASMTMDLKVSRNSCATTPSPLPAEPPEQVSSAEPPPQSNLSALQSLPEGTHVRVTGMLENVGTNYFKTRERDIALVSEDGTVVKVLVEKPLEARPSKEGTAPPSVASMLGKPVVVEGTVKWTDTAKGRELKLDAASVESAATAQQ